MGIWGAWTIPYSGVAGTLCIYLSEPDSGRQIQGLRSGADPTCITGAAQRLVAVIVTVEDPGEVGVPVIIAVAGSNFRPAGRPLTASTGAGLPVTETAKR